MPLLLLLSHASPLQVHLRVFSCFGCKLEGDLPWTLQLPPHLEQLHVNGTCLSGEVPWTSIGRAPALVECALHDNAFTGRVDVRALAADNLAHTLQAINVFGNPGLATNEKVRRALEVALPKAAVVC